MTKEEIENIALLVDFENFTANPDDVFDIEKLYRMLNLPNKARFIVKKAYGDDEIIYYSNLTSEELDITDITNAYKLLKDAIVELQNENKLPLGSVIKSKLKQIQPSFSETEFGFPQWKFFLEHASEDGVIDLEKHESGDYLVKLPKIDGKETKHIEFTDSFYSKLYRSIENSKGKDNKSLFSRIKDELQAIDSSFSIKKYGISKTKGFSAFMRLLSEKGLVQIFRRRYTYSAIATEKLKKLSKYKEKSI